MDQSHLFWQAKTKTKADLCIVGGGGHVGFPLALVFAASGIRTIIYDTNLRTIDIIASGRVPFKERGAEELLERAIAERTLWVSSDASCVGHVPAVAITIGTPVDEYHNPMFRVVRECIDALLPHMVDGQLVVLRSTVFPGTTEWLDRHVRSSGRRVKLAFCPERVVQGLAIEEIRQHPQLVGGITEEAAQAAGSLFGRVAPSVVRVSPREAELAKLFSNAFRYIQFATANQFYVMANNAGADYKRIISALKKDYPRAAGLPGAGFSAGPCLFKDTMQLAAFFNNQFTLGHAAMLVNEGMPLYVVEQLQRRCQLSESRVGLLGMAFKPDIDDARDSLSYKLKKTLQFRAKSVLTTDPYITTDPDLLPLEAVLEGSDVLVLCIPHSEYRDLPLPGKPIVDLSGVVSERGRSSGG